jgi:hypothetical protein
MTTILWNQFASSPAPGPRPYVLVTPNGPTDGGDFGPNSTLWSGSGSSQTGGIQEALYFLSSHSIGGTVYVTGGSYSISAAIANTGSNQVVIFEAGVTLNFSSAASQITDANLGSVWFAIASSYGFNSTYANYSHVRWYGNGCVINLTNTTPSATTATIFGLFQYGKNDSHSSSPYLAGIDFVVDGFVIPNAPTNSTVWFVGVDHYTTLPISGTSGTSNGLLQKIRNVRLSRIFYTAKSGSVSGNGPYPTLLQGAWHNVVIEDCSVDTLNVTSTTLCNGLFIRANAGDAEQAIVRRCYFRTAPGTTPSVVQIQGNLSGNNPTAPRICQQVYIEDSTFDSGLTTPQGQEIYINDVDFSNNDVGYATNIEFRRCIFLNCELYLLAYGNYFGYVRFMDCQSAAGNAMIPSSGSSTLSRRYPMTANFSSISVGSSPFIYSNLDGVEELVAVVGGTLTNVYWGSGVTGTTPTGSLNGTYRLRPGDVLTVAYSGAPTMYKFAV